jgi:hypothetical protein
MSLPRCRQPPQSADPGAKHDLLADDRELRALIPQTLIRFDDAVRNTLKEEEKLVNSSDWGYDAQALPAGARSMAITRNRPAAR